MSSIFGKKYAEKSQISPIGGGFCAFFISISSDFCYLFMVSTAVWRIFKGGDALVFILFISVTVASFCFLRTSQSVEKRLVITSGRKEYIYPLEKNRELEIAGALGNSVIVIEDGRAFFKSSPCKNHVCVQMGTVAEENDWAACLPNDIFIRVE